MTNSNVAKHIKRNFLKELKKFGNKENYFKVKEISNFNNAKKQKYDHINVKAIDFDKTKTEYCRKKRIQLTPKSCDAIDIVDLKYRINFIEFKLLWHKKAKDLKNIRDLIKKIKKFRMSKKIEDSLNILLEIIKEQNFYFENKEKVFNCCEKKFIIVLGFDNGIHGTKERTYFLRAKAEIKKDIKRKSAMYGISKKPHFLKSTEFNQKYPKRFQ